MGKGNRNRRDPNRGKPPDDMAPDAPMPERNTMPWAQRVVSAACSGWLVQLHYMAAYEDGQGIPTVPPPSGSESEAERAQRAELSGLLAKAHVAAGDWSGTVADELHHIRPTDAPHVVEAQLDVARDWWQDSGYTSMVSEHVPAIEAQLDGLVPPHRRADVQELVDTVAAGPDVDVTRARYRLMGAANSMPFESIHVAAAMVVALWRTPACVPAPTEAQLALAKKLERYLKGDV